jgi:integrase
LPAKKTITLKDGSKRYEFTVDEPRVKAADAPLTPERRQTVIAALTDAAEYRRRTDPGQADAYETLARELADEGQATKRKQITRRFRTRRERDAELARIGHQIRTGEYVRPWDGTVNELLDAYLRSATFEKEDNTKANYEYAVQPIRERLGHRLGQSVIRGDIEAMRDWMLTSGRRRGGTPGTGLRARSVRLSLGRGSAAFQQAVDDGWLYRNPFRGVKLPAQARREWVTWDEAQVRLFLAAADADRLAACWRLSLYGMRRAEVLGLLWKRVDLEARTVTIATTRVLVGGQVVTKAPKSANGTRTLPLDDALVAALRALRKLQAAERLAAGEAYTDSGYVAVDELGAPAGLEWYSDEFARLAARAGVPKIRLHDARHSCLSLLEKAGVPISIVSAWAGHYDAAFTLSNYVHAGAPDLAQGRDALARIFKIENGL